MKKAIAIVMLSLTACQPLPPCEDDYCRQTRVMMLQGIIVNQQRTNELQQQNLWRVIQPPVQIRQGFSCSHIGTMTYCN